MLLVAFHLFVISYEEPTLYRLFGDDYETYRRAVGRWIPRRLGPPLGLVMTPGHRRSVTRQERRTARWTGYLPAQNLVREPTG